MYTQTFFYTRLIINKINKVQWVDFKLENVLVSLHSLKTMGFGLFGSSASLFLRNGELLGHSPIQNKAALLNYRLETFLIRMMMRVMLQTVNS
jgi:ABC-type microcin C transport system permease subunit YejE